MKNERKIFISLSFDEAEEILNKTDSKLIRDAILQDLGKQKKECEFELAKVIIMLDAVNSGDYRYMTDALRDEMYEIIGRNKNPLLLEAINYPESWRSNWDDPKNDIYNQS